MSAAHTPGPWTIHKSRALYHGAKVDTEIRGNGYVVVRLGNIYHDTGEADARLIAAAPELLAALEEVLNAYIPGWDQPEHTDIGGSIMHARAAIAKAKQS